MKYIMNKYCRGTFNISKTIDLNNFLNQDEQEKFVELKSKSKKDMTDEEFDWIQDVYQRIKEESEWYEGIRN